MTAGLVAELRERLTKAREQIDQLTSDIMKTGNAAADAGVKLAIAAHHIESAQQLLRLLESNRSRRNRSERSGHETPPSL